MKRTVELVVSPRSHHFVGDGFRVINFIPSTFRLDMERMDPFILLDYNSEFYFPPSDKQRGVDVHPHKGFETITLAYKGAVAHHDSAGNSGVIYPGDVQWMTAGNGILHKEYHEEEFTKNGGDFHMVQLWVNLSAENKKQNPKYQSIVNSDIPKCKLDDNSYIEVVSGAYKNVKGVASTFSPVHMYNVILENNTEVDLSFPSHYNTGILVLSGSVSVNGEEHAPVDHFILMNNDGEDFTVKGTSSDTKILVLSGEPLNEPIVAYGPFVMNTEGEIKQAFVDFKEGEFGSIEE